MNHSEVLKEQYSFLMLLAKPIESGWLTQQMILLRQSTSFK